MVEDSPRLRLNNFDFVRLMLAVTVCLVHTSQLSGLQALNIFERVLSSSAAVKAFFVVSGFLIFMSYERSISLYSYFKKRARRIYPAYFFVIVVFALCLVFVSSQSTTDYFSSSWTRYLVSNLAFLNMLAPTLPGVFESNKVSAVNGALWTLKIEVMFYVSVPIFALIFKRFDRLKAIVVIYFSSICYVFLMTALAEKTKQPIYLELGRQLPGQLQYFMAGAFFYYYLPYFEQHVARYVCGALLVLIASFFFPLTLITPFALATIVIFVSLYFYLGEFGKYGDFSYGAYILHFPVIQILLTIAWFRESPWALLASVIGFTAIGAFLMWHCIEKRFIRRKADRLEVVPVAA